MNVYWVYKAHTFILQNLTTKKIKLDKLEKVLRANNDNNANKNKIKTKFRFSHRKKERKTINK